MNYLRLKSNLMIRTHPLLTRYSVSATVNRLRRVLNTIGQYSLTLKWLGRFSLKTKNRETRHASFSPLSNLKQYFNLIYVSGIPAGHSGQYTKLQQ